MASPQTENGYTMIANEILEVFAKTDMNGTQRRILDVVVRQTYGFKRISHDLSISFIAVATNIHTKQVQRELNKLIERNIVTVVSLATFSKSRKLSINKNYECWISGEVANQLPPNEIDTHTGSELVPSRGSGLAPQRKKKENIKEICALNFEELWKLYPNKKGKTSISDKTKETVYKVGTEIMIQAINKYKQELLIETWKHPMNGSTFFNGRYKDYFSTEVPEKPLSQPLKIIYRDEI